MDEKRISGDDPHYEETKAPQNPPNSMVNPDARTRWLASSVGVLALIFLIVAAVFTWVFVQRELGRDDRDESLAEAVGTSGERQPREGTPGGFDPAPRPGNYRDELEYRGNPGDPATAVAGSRVSLSDVRVERTDGETFWIRSNNATLAVVAPGGMPTVRAGQRVNITGTVEGNGDARRIRAARIDVK